MSLDQLTTNPFVSTVINLFNPATEEIEAPLDFEAATDDSIQPGDFVLTVFGWWAVVNTVRTTSKGAIGYSVNMLYRTSHGSWIAPVKTTRRWIWDTEVLEVLS